MDTTRLFKAPKNKKELSFLHRKYYNGLILLTEIYNRSVAVLEKKTVLSGNSDLNEIRIHAQTPSDINDHLETIFIESLQAQPKLIVELGVGPGQSTYVFEKVAKLTGAHMVSVDIRPEMGKTTTWPGWNFIEADDVEFAGKFLDWARGENINPQIDILFIDTSHKYDHTVQEIKKWFPFLSEKAKVFFHDTNTGPVYWRKNGGIGFSYDIQRGVIRAIEGYFNTKFNEKSDFNDVQGRWLIRHFAVCNGLTILNKIL